MQKGRKPPVDTNGLVHFIVTSGFGHNTRQPFVAVQLGEYETQLAPSDARALALNLLAASEAALSDGFLVEFLKEQIDLEEPMIAGILNEFRRWRTKKDQWGTPSA